MADVGPSLWQEAMAPSTITHVSVMSRKTVRITLTIASLNDLEVKLGKISNVYIQKTVTEKVWTTLSLEFGKDARLQ